MNNSYKEHWEHIFSEQEENSYSWFQPYPKTSMKFVELFDVPLNAHIIDIGGGDSHFADALLDRGFQNVYVLDISSNAIARARERLGNKASKVHWIVSDITEFKAPVQFDLWHDRAAFHFLTTEEKIQKYRHIASASIREGGYFILGTFSENGPKKCSGLEIRRYSEASMIARFEDRFDHITCLREDHVTPLQAHQDFLFCAFKRKRSQDLLT